MKWCLYKQELDMICIAWYPGLHSEWENMKDALRFSHEPLLFKTRKEAQALSSKINGGIKGPWHWGRCGVRQWEKIKGDSK